MPEMPKPQIAPFKFGIAARRAESQAQLAEVDPTKCTHRLAIIFDDSGSMSGEPFSNAKKAVANFSASCNPLETSLAIIPLGVKEDKNKAKPLTNDYDLLNLFVTAMSLNSVGTPLYEVMLGVLDQPATRLVVFSDGEPTDDRNSFSWGNPDPETANKPWKQRWLSKAQESKVPHDTVFIGTADSEGYKEMKWIAEQTGGIFIHFKDSLSLATSLKYLSPGLRGLLANPEVKAKIEKGEKL